jgi:hypothetical protein
MDTDIEVLFAALDIDVTANGTVDDCIEARYAAYYNAFLAAYVIPTIAAIATVANVVSLRPLLRMTWICYPPYAYLAILCSMHAVVCTCVLCMQSDWLASYVRQSKDVSPAACHLIHYIGDVTEQFQNWLTVHFIALCIYFKVGCVYLTVRVSIYYTYTASVFLSALRLVV